MNARYTTIALALLAGVAAASGQPQQQQLQGHPHRCSACGVPRGGQQQFKQGRRFPQQGAYGRQGRLWGDRRQNARFAPQQRHNAQRKSFQERRPDRFQRNGRQFPKKLTPQQKRHLRKQFAQTRQQQAAQGFRLDQDQGNRVQKWRQLTPQQRGHIEKMQQNFKREVRQYLSNQKGGSVDGVGKNPKKQKEATPPKKQKPRDMG